MSENYYTYILASKKHGTLYTGVTNNLERRICEHKSNTIQGFTNKYGVHILVHYEVFSNINDAIRHEKTLKNWTRKWKIELIEKTNPDWCDLSKDLDSQAASIDSGSSPE